MSVITYQQPNEQGYYGSFGGAYIPEMLHRNVEELRTKYLEIIYEEGFQKEFQQLLRDYVGRPTPLYLAERLSKRYGAVIYLKREDLCHTGAHKINNTIGQILLAQRLGKKKNHSRNRGWSAWRGYRYCMCIERGRVHCVHGRKGYRTAGAECGENENAGCNGDPGDQWKQDPEGCNE